MIVGVIWRKPVLTRASIVFGGTLASVNSVNDNDEKLIYRTWCHFLLAASSAS